MAKSSHRVSFERWLRWYGRLTVTEVAAQYTRGGQDYYQIPEWNAMFAAYKHAISVERGRQHDRVKKNLEGKR